MTAELKRGHDGAVFAFCELLNLLLGKTVSATGNSLRVYAGERRASYLLSSHTGYLNPLELRDGRFLDVRIGLAIHRDKEGTRLRVDHSVFQYQCDASGQSWVFRYEYNRHPFGPHPPSHLHVRGRLVEDCLRSGELLERIHFPAMRVSIEAVIRLLIDQFHVRTVLRRGDWRKLLTQTEREFLQIAHRAASGPRR